MFHATNIRYNSVRQFLPFIETMLTRTSFFYSVLLVVVSLSISAPIFAHGGNDHNHYTREQVAWQKINHGALLIDVRTLVEFNEGHLNDALHMPYKTIVKSLKEKHISKDTEIVLYCRSGNRAGKSIKMLMKAGYSNLHNGGGISALRTAKSQPESSLTEIK